MPLNIKSGIKGSVLKESDIHIVIEPASYWIKAFITFLRSRVPDKDTFEGFRIEFPSKVIVNLNIGRATKDFKRNCMKDV